jgi:hypothetical protein
MGTLSDLGMTSGEKITIEHVLILSTSAAWDEAICRIVSVWGSYSRGALGSLNAVGYGFAAYLVLSGISKVIDSTKKKDSSD